MGAMQLKVVYVWRLKPEGCLPGVSVLYIYRGYVPGYCLGGGGYPEAVCLKGVLLEAV